MEKNLSYLLVGLFTFIFACNAVDGELELDLVPEELYINLSDSCSYTIDNKIYNCNRVGSIYSGGTAQVNPEFKTGKGYEDSVYFTTGMDLINFEDKAYMTIMFAKKYGKNQLLKNNLNLYVLPEDEKRIFYSEKRYPFAVDYERSNTMNGVALSFSTYDGDDYLMRYNTYSPAPWGRETSVMNDVQKDSEFEIIKIHTLPNGSTIIEAKFKAKVFGQYFYDAGSGISEEAKMVEDGYVRFRVRMF